VQRIVWLCLLAVALVVPAGIVAQTDGGSRSGASIIKLYPGQLKRVGGVLIGCGTHKRQVNLKVGWQVTKRVGKTTYLIKCVPEPKKAAKPVPKPTPTPTVPTPTTPTPTPPPTPAPNPNPTPTPPPNPTPNPTAKLSVASDGKLSWTATAGATGYRVAEVVTGSEVGIKFTTVSASVLTFTPTAHPGETWDYDVQPTGGAWYGRVSYKWPGVAPPPVPPYTVCASGCPYTSIMDAVHFAKAGDTITVGPGTYTQGQSCYPDDGTCSTTIWIDKDLTLHGAGASQTFIGGGNHFTLTVNSGNVVLSGVTFNVGGNGGSGISNGGNLRLDDSVVTGYSAVFGGGITNGKTLTLNRTTVTGNFADMGGGIVNNGSASLNSSVVSNNRAGLEGGGIVNTGSLFLNATNVFGNGASDPSATGRGGGVVNEGGTVTLSGSNISNNWIGTNKAPSNCVGFVCPTP